MEIGALFASRRPDYDYDGDNHHHHHHRTTATRSLVLPLIRSSASLTTAPPRLCDEDVWIVRLCRTDAVTTGTAAAAAAAVGLVRAIIPTHLIRTILSETGDGDVDDDDDNWKWELVPAGPALVPVPVTEPLVRGCGVPVPFPTHWMCSDLLQLVDRLRPTAYRSSPWSDAAEAAAECYGRR